MKIASQMIAGRCDRSDHDPVDEGTDADQRAAENVFQKKIGAVDEEIQNGKIDAELRRRSDHKGSVGIISHERELEETDTDPQKEDADQHEYEAAYIGLIDMSGHDTSGSQGLRAVLVIEEQQQIHLSIRKGYPLCK